MEPIAGAPAYAAATRDVAVGETVVSRRYDPASGAGALLGLALIVLGGVALARTGTDAPFSTPVIDVMGWTHDAPLAVTELASGLLLLLAALSGFRGFLLFVSALVAAGALVLAIEPTAIDRLAIDRSMAVVLAIVAGVVFLMAAIAPTMTHESARIDQERVATD